MPTDKPRMSIEGKSQSLKVETFNDNSLIRIYEAHNRHIATGAWGHLLPKIAKLLSDPQSLTDNMFNS